MCKILFILLRKLKCYKVEHWHGIDILTATIEQRFGIESKE